MKRILFAILTVAIISCMKPGDDDYSDTIQISEIVEDGSGYFEAVGVVAAVGKTAFIISDDTGSMLVYSAPNQLKEGDKIYIQGNVSTYKAGYTPQFDSDSKITHISSGNQIQHSPLLLNGPTATSWGNNVEGFTRVREVEVTGYLSFSPGSNGNYHYANVTIAESNVQGSILYVDNSNYATADGLSVRIKGYAISISVSASRNYINILPYSVSW